MLVASGDDYFFGGQGRETRFGGNDDTKFFGFAYFGSIVPGGNQFKRFGRGGFIIYV